MSDRLERAFRSVREEADGRSAGAEETLARVLRDLSRAPARRVTPVGARVWLLSAAVLAISTVAAARSGQLGRVLHALVGSPGDATPAMRAPASPARAVSTTLAVTPPQAPPVEVPLPQAPPEPADTAPALVAPPRASTANAPAALRSHAPQRSTTAPTAAEPAPMVPPATPSTNAAPAVDDQAFAAAHALHFHGSDPARALVAWDDYLRDFPQGRFAPEARYNRAIDLLKLGRAAEATDALRPFAAGAYGPYRRDEARAILRSIDPTAATAAP